GRKEVVTRGATGTHRYTYSDYYRRVCRLGNVLRALGIQPGERVATLGWNTSTHLELYFGIPCSGAVLHTLNLRLLPEQIGYTAAHAEDAVLFVDQSLFHLYEQFRQRVPSFRHVIVMNEEEHRPAPPGVLHYEELLAGASESIEWPRLEENAAAAM